MSQLLCYEPFHLGAEFLTELPTTSSRFYPIRARKAFRVVLGIMLDDTINRAIADQHERAARDVAHTLESPPFFVYESDLAPIACALASVLDRHYLDERNKVLKIQPPWSASPIKLLSIVKTSDLVVDTLLTDPKSVIVRDRCGEVAPTCSLYILAWNYLRAFSGELLLDFADFDRSQMQAVIKASALAVLDSADHGTHRAPNMVLSYLNRSYEAPEERSRIIGHFLDNDYLRTILSDRMKIEVEFYSMFETDAMIEA